MTAPWSRSKKTARKAADDAVCAEASRWLHQVVAEAESDQEPEGVLVTAADAVPEVA
jgi:hypothetical protein